MSRLHQQLAEARFRNELTRIDREWESDREKYYVAGQLPSVGMAIRTPALGCVVGLGWTVFTVGNGDPFGCFSVWGVIVAVFGVGSGIHIYFRAQEYVKALAAYQGRRNAIRIDEFQSPGDPVAQQGENGQYSIPNDNHRRTSG